MHDMGMLAVKRIENGEEKRGFEVYVGGGLGAVPYQAKLYDSFVPVENCQPLAQSIVFAFAARGERKNRARGGSSSWSRIWESKNSRNWFCKSARICRPTRGGRNSCRVPSSLVRRH